MQFPKTRYTNPVLYLVIFIPAIVYFYFVNKYALDIPSQDDYVAVLDFLSRWSQAHGWDKFFLLFNFHNEHRILSSRIVYVLLYKLTGGINFRHIIFIGNAQLLGILLIIIHFNRKLLPGYWFIASFVVSVALFDLNNWENTCFAMACMQNFGIVFLFLLSLFLYAREGKISTATAVLIQILCTYSSGNGMIASAFLVLFNLLSGNKVKPYISTLTFLIFVPLYFFHYNPPPSAHASTNIPQVAMYIFCFIGNHIYYGDKIVGLIAGLCVFTLLIFAMLPVKRVLGNKRLLPLLCITGFLIATIVLTSFFRSNPDLYISSRYLIYPHLLIGLLFTFLLAKFQGKKVLMPFAALFTVLMLIAYNMNFRGGRIELDQRYGFIKDSDYFFPDKNYGKAATETACRLNIYCIDKHRLPHP